MDIARIRIDVFRAVGSGLGDVGRDASAGGSVGVEELEVGGGVSLHRSVLFATTIITRELANRDWIIGIVSFVALTDDGHIVIRIFPQVLQP